MTRKTEWCEICEEVEVRYHDLRLCHKCYQYIWRWKKRSIKAIIRRQRDVEVYEKRLSIIGADKGSN